MSLPHRKNMHTNHPLPPTSAGSASPKPRAAFTLIELLVSMAVLSLLMVMVFSMVDSTQKTWEVARSRVSQFREARVAFEAVTQDLRQATLNTYIDYDYGDGKYRSSDLNNPKPPKGFQRQSELHFISGPSSDLLGAQGGDNFPGHAIFFQVPGGFGTDEKNAQLNDLLNARGYFVEYGDDSSFKPGFLNSEVKPRFRFRLMELRPPTENLQIYIEDLKAAGDDGVGASDEALREWFIGEIGGEFAGGAVKRPIADNIIAAFFLPKLPEASETTTTLAPDYVYDSRLWQTNDQSTVAALTKNQLPPLVEVTMVAVDEKSMIRYQLLNPDSKNSAPEFIPSNLFTSFSSYRKFLDDIEALKTSLDAKQIEYRIFSQVVPMRSAGWSES